MGIVVAWVLWRRPVLLARARGNAFVLPILIACGMTALQFAVIPMPLLSIVAPGAHAVRQMNENSLWVPLSLDVPATCMALLTLGTYATAAVATTALFRNRRHYRELSVAICVGGGCTALLGLGTALFDDSSAQSIFGPSGGGFSATFVNPNHAAAYLGFVSLVSLGLAFDARRMARLAFLIVGELCGACVLLSLSRGATLSYMALLTVVAVVVCAGPRDSDRIGMLWALFGVVVLGATLAYSNVVHELWTLNNPQLFNKTVLWRAALPLIRDFPFFGMGRGVFEVVSPRYIANASTLATYTHLENEWLQTLVDFGPVVGLLLIILVARAAWPLVRDMRSSATGAGLGAAILFVGLENVADFSLQCPALAFPLALLLTSHGCRFEDVRNLHAPQVSRPRLWMGYSAAMTLAVTLCLVGTSHSLQRDTERMSHIDKDVAGTPAMRAKAREAALAWHPSDWVIPLTAAQGALQRGELRDAQHWAIVAAQLAPDWAEPYRLLGRIALARGRYDDAVTAYGSACAFRLADAAEIGREILTFTKQPDLVVRLSEMTAYTCVPLANVLLPSAPAAALQVLSESSPAEPVEVSLLRSRAQLALGRFVEAAKWARTSQINAPRNTEAYILESEAERAVRDFDRALTALRRGLDETEDVERLTPPIASLLTDLGRFAEARAYAHLLLERSGISVATAHRLLGRAWQREGKLREALNEYEKCRTAWGNDAGVRIDIAGLREQVGDIRGAVREIEMAQHIVPQPQSLQPYLDDLRKKLRAQTDALLQESVNRDAAVF